MGGLSVDAGSSVVVYSSGMSVDIASSRVDSVIDRVSGDVKCSVEMSFPSFFRQKKY